MIDKQPTNPSDYEDDHHQTVPIDDFLARLEFKPESKTEDKVREVAQLVFTHYHRIPTITHIRHALKGRGGAQNIQKALEVWSADIANEYSSLKALPSVPEEVGEQFVQIWQQAVQAGRALFDNEVRAIRAEMNQAKDQARQAKDDYQGLQTINDSIKQDLSALQDKHLEQEQALQASSDQMETLRDHEQNLIRHAEKLRHEVIQLQKDKELLTQQAKSHFAELTQQKTSIDDLKNALSLANEHQESLKLAHTKALEQIRNDYEFRLGKQDAQIQKLENDNQRSQETFHQALAKQEALREKHDQILVETTALKSELTSTESALEAALTDSKRLRTKLAEADHQLQETRDEMLRAQASAASNKELLDVLRSDLVKQKKGD